jgi:hypothetical protein
MNPWSVVLLLLGIACLIIGAKGTQDNAVAMLKGKKYGKSTLT